jgi:hypothetical protein
MFARIAAVLATFAVAALIAQARPDGPSQRVSKLAAVVRADSPDFAATAPPPEPTLGGARAFGAACDNDKECASGVCSKGKRNGFCSMKCEADSDCPNPPTAGACNGRGFCKKPGTDR